jgi:omega-hydroxy-beta-dihydromenaquinone-9 sulfotransferase
VSGRAPVWPLGREAFAWVSEGGKPDRGGRGERFMLRWRSWWFERHRALQRSLRPPPSLQADPVFVVGLWRSGTTFMHELLAAWRDAICPTTWQCMGSASFRLRPPLASGTRATRPMDGFTVEAHSPQEDEFALLALGVPSVYRGFLDPRRLPELALWLDPDSWRRDSPSGWLVTWLDFLSAVADGRAGRLIVKSPAHTFRLRAIAETFPDASYVWIVRDPIEMFLSNCKMWAAMFGRYSFWNWDPEILEEFLLSAFSSAARVLTSITHVLPRRRFVVVEFSRLIERSVDVAEGVNRRLELGRWPQMRPVVLDVAARKTAYQRDTYGRDRLAPAVHEIAERLRVAQTAALLSHGL